LPTGNLGISAVPSESFLSQFLVQNPNVTTWAVSFNITPSVNQPGVTLYQYQLWYNFTNAARTEVSYAPGGQFLLTSSDPFGDSILPVMRAVDEAICKSMTIVRLGCLQTLPRFAHLLYLKSIVAVTTSTSLTTPKISLSQKDLPQLSGNAVNACPKNPDQTFSNMGPIFLLVPMTVIFFTTLNTIVGEKEKNLKDYMEISGLMPVVFWLSHFLIIGLNVLFTALVLCLFGLAFGFSLFKNSDFSVSLQLHRPCEKLLFSHIIAGDLFAVFNVRPLVGRVGNGNLRSLSSGQIGNGARIFFRHHWIHLQYDRWLCCLYLVY
jgi:hypothetical protein